MENQNQESGAGQKTIKIQVPSAENIAGRRSLIPAFFTAAILFFFFNFFTVSCGEQKVGSVTGINLLTGTELKNDDIFSEGETEGKEIPSSAWAIIAFGTAIIGLGAFLIKERREALIGAGAGAIGFCSLLILQFAIKNTIEKEAGGIIQTDFKFAYWAALISMGIAGFISYLRIKKGTDFIKNEEKQSTNGLDSPTSFRHLGLVLLAVVSILIMIWSPWTDKSLDEKEYSNEKIQDDEDVQISFSLEEFLEEPNDSMILVQGGTFTMGCTDNINQDLYKYECFENEYPAHQVAVSDFYIGKYEVTQKVWQALMGNNPSYFQNCDNCPVENVSWNDIQQFLSKLNAKTGKKYRLPTEAEWEYAARGGRLSEGYDYAGLSRLFDAGWGGNQLSQDDYRTHPVGLKNTNELGLYDMSGNVSEWCQDWYGRYSSSTQKNPTGPKNGYARILRGGSWNDGPENCRVSARMQIIPQKRSNYYEGSFGFRLARSL